MCREIAAILVFVSSVRTLTRADSATCSGHGCTANWWESGESHFRSPNVIQIGTLNFNETLRELRNHSLFIAFYDPRSQSFRELQPAIEQTADALAKSPTPLGYFGAVDITVHSYLTFREAPEVQLAWQEPNPSKKSFRFGRPRFYPLIILHYKDGFCQQEYKGVVKKKHLLNFLQRDLIPKGEMQNSSEDLEFLFTQFPGPFILGCGLEEGTVDEANLTAAFQAAARHLGGEMIFAQARQSLCSGLVHGAVHPSVLYIRNSAAKALPGPISANVESSMKVLCNEDKLIDWLRLQRPVVLKEITPDNSWIFLEQPASLVIFLATSKDSVKEGKALFAEIEAELDIKYFQLTWADCHEFQAQFSVDCPAVVVVDTESMNTSDLALETILREGPSAASRALHARLLDATAAVRRRVDQAAEAAAAGHRSGEAERLQGKEFEEIAWQEAWPLQVLEVLKNEKVKVTDEGLRYKVVDVDGQTIRFRESETKEILQDPDRFPLRIYFNPDIGAADIDETEADSSENFLGDWAIITENTSALTTYRIYLACLQHMVILRQSFQQAWGQRLFFDFSAIDRSQKVHRRGGFGPNSGAQKHRRATLLFCPCSSAATSDRIDLSLFQEHSLLHSEQKKPFMLSCFLQMALTSGFNSCAWA